MSDLYLIAIVAVVASALSRPWWYPPLCAAVLVTFRVLTSPPWWTISSYENEDISLLVFAFGLTIAVGWFAGWFIRQGLLFWTRRM